MDIRIYRRARLARDPRFDGRFFIGVVTTGIYCRPICPAPAPKEKNVRYFPSAAAAAEAGFRPCLRCRPEASPGTPAWLGASATVSRALKLIGESALDDSGVEDLAARLGIGARHLRRLFVRYLGATPVAVARTRRVHFAKKLIDDTNLPMTQIAMAAGFGSIRRFNATFQELYGRAPRELRKAKAQNAHEPGVYEFRLAYRPPYDWDSLLGFLAPRANIVERYIWTAAPAPSRCGPPAGIRSSCASAIPIPRRCFASWSACGKFSTPAPTPAKLPRASSAIPA